MELKPSYKHTEIGLIPEDWEVLPAAQIGRFRGGTGFPLAYQGLQEGAFPFYKVSDMNNDGNETFMVAANNWISEETRRFLGAHAFPAGSIVFAKVGAAVFLERKKILSRASCLDNNMTAFILDEDKASAAFLHAQLLDKKLGDLVATTALPSLSGKILGEMLLALPPLAEQSAIANALSDVDTLLAAQDALIEKKRVIKQGATQELLTGKRRLPGFGGDWEVKRLGEVASFFKGKGLPKSALSESGAEPCIHYGELFTRHPETICQILSFTDHVVGAVRSVANDVLMPTSDVTPRGLASASCVAVDGIILGGDILGIRPDAKRIFGPFLSFLIRYEETQVLQLVTGSTVFHLYGSDMKNFTFAMPPVDEQKAIAEALSEMTNEIMMLETKRAKTALLRQGMMQELLTGRTRLV